MKKIITTIAIALITNTAINAQVTKPKVNVNRGQVNSTPMVQGLEVRNLDKMTPAEFKKLKIPVTQVVKEKVNAKPTRTWSIKPMKLMDGNLRFSSYEGLVKPQYWTFGNNNYDKIPSLQFTFKMNAYAYYRVRLIPMRQSNLADLLLTYCNRSSPSGTSECLRTAPDLNNEFTYTITKRQNTTLTLSNMFKDNIGRHISIKEVIIDRID